MADDVERDVGRILMVCSANVCRSPLAALHLREALVHGPLKGAVIESAGVRGLEGAEMCAEARECLADPAMGWSHVGRMVTKSLVQSADLVLTMENEQRNAVVRSLPRQQGKVFTLREAVAMSEALADSGATPQTVAELTTRMGELRGIVRPPAAAPIERHGLRRFLRASKGTIDDGLSINDGHNIDPRAHRATVEAVRALSGRLGSALNGMSAEPQGVEVSR